MKFSKHAVEITVAVFVVVAMTVVVVIAFFNITTPNETHTVFDPTQIITEQEEPLPYNKETPPTAQQVITADDIPVNMIETLLLTYGTMHNYLSPKISVVALPHEYSDLLYTESSLLANAVLFSPTDNSATNGVTIAKGIATWLGINSPNKTVDNAKQISDTDLLLIGQALVALESEKEKVLAIEGLFANEIKNDISYMTLHSLEMQYDTIGAFLDILEEYKSFNAEQLNAVDLVTQGEEVKQQTLAFSHYLKGLREGGNSSTLINDLITTSLTSQYKLVQAHQSSIDKLQNISIDPESPDAELYKQILDARINLYTTYKTDAEYAILTLKEAQRAYETGTSPTTVYKDIQNNWSNENSQLIQNFMDVTFAVQKYKRDSYAKTLYYSLLAYDDVLQDLIRKFALQFNVATSLSNMKPLRSQLSDNYQTETSPLMDELKEELNTQPVVLSENTTEIPQDVAVAVVIYTTGNDCGATPQLFVGQNDNPEHIVYPYNSTDYLVQTRDDKVYVYLTQPVPGTWRAQARADEKTCVPSIDFGVVR